MLTLENLSFGVQDEKSQKEIIRNLNLTIESNKFVVVTGPNGGGKSTLAKLIAGIEKPTGGRILLDGADITEKNITERAQSGISYAFQQPVRFKGIEVFDLLRLASGKELNITDACQYLSEVGLCAKDYIKREVNDSLSGGELKRIEIATVLARGTKLSIFDAGGGNRFMELPESDRSIRAHAPQHQKWFDFNHLSSGEDSGYRRRDCGDRKRSDQHAGPEG